MILQSLAVITAAITAYGYQPSPAGELFPFSRAIPAASPLAYMETPSDIPGYRSTSLAASFGKPYMIDGLDTMSSAFSITRESYIVSSGIASYGTEYYRETEFFASGGYMPSRFTAFGAKMHINRTTLDLDTRFTSVLADTDLSTQLNAGRWNVAFFQKNIRSVFNTDVRDLLYPVRGFGLRYTPAEGYSAAFNCTFEEFRRMYSGELGVNLTENLSLALGYAPAANTYAMTASVSVFGIITQYTVRHHTYLGKSHVVSVCWTGEPRRYTPVRYLPDQSRLAVSIEPVDIRHCTHADLAAIPLMNDDYAERILNYRAMFGPVSITALKQLGFESAQIDTLRKYTTGISPDPANRHDEKNKRTERKPLSKDKSRLLFKELTASGLSFAKASYICRQGERFSLEFAISTLKNREYTADELKLVRKICARY